MIHTSAVVQPVASWMPGEGEESWSVPLILRLSHSERTCQGSVRLYLVPTSKYEFPGVHRREMLRCFEADSIIGANDEDGLSSEIGAYDWGY